ILAFGDTEHDYLGCFAEIVARWTNQVADVFDEKQIDIFQLPVGKMALDHARIEMACATGCNLFHREAEAAEAIRIVFGLNVSGEHSHAPSLRQTFQRALQ